MTVLIFFGLSKGVRMEHFLHLTFESFFFNKFKIGINFDSKIFERQKMGQQAIR